MIRRIFLLTTISLALMGADCEESHSRRAVLAGADAAGFPAAPIPEPSGALIFSLALCILCVRGAWEAGKR
jgi:hypothetical protein